ncbi:RnfABCDGE type electron transport complex subunit G [Clostridium botulinum]|uniref:Ion-translocating oxidoreductase complex subunit G n=1 Tax=Clostridium botulinum TaxID=1491 RepID=A0A9Q1ZDL4_CLOBO|nr:RnfABCDGE type electron transport complex subunit G [Clostridium botulinum]AEB75439.1 electron transport complex, RnfABCDGE type, G subunit [Clostridium botulinum BKT015925]KEH99074.1 electron transporter RnfG [Clostridium botulinum D str. 16868]KEI00783.1 electron transporter RnfG [Clostridium botulinum C/D str. Sp77]KLU74838.1 electron transporter RnfG [Clostridium botulinum V891]KOA73168.1 electron transporter RnfG [Clostridium botulinum]
MENQNSSKEILMLGLKLFIITAIAGLILGWAHKVTLAPINEQNIKTNNEAMNEVLPSAKEFAKIAAQEVQPGEKVEKQLSKENPIVEVNKGQNSGTEAGYAIKVATKGYGGLIEMMVGISKEGKVEGIKILAHTETPGLGAKAPEPGFADQYKGKSIDKPLEVVKGDASGDNQISAITGATITSKAVTKGVNDAVEYYNKELKGGQK